MSDTTQQPMLSADGRPLKQSLARALRRQKIRALLLIAPLLLFVVVTFIIPILSMLFRSVENEIVSNTLPHTVVALQEWDGTTNQAPDEEVYRHLYFDLFRAVESKEHTKLGSRLNYEQTGLSSLFRTSGRSLDDLGEEYQDPLEEIDPRFKEGAFWYEMLNGEGGEELLESRRELWRMGVGESMAGDIGFVPSAQMAEMLPWTTRAYTDFAIWTVIDDEDVVAEEDPWEAVYAGLAQDLQNPETITAISNYSGPGAEALQAAANNVDKLPEVNFREGFAKIKEDWASPEVWSTIQVFSANYTPGYFLNAVDLELTPDGVQAKPENQQIYMQLFMRTLWMALVITGACIVLGYPVAWLLANLPMRVANTLMILVLLPFWTSLLVRTSAWKVLLQQQGVINDILVWLGFVGDADRLILMNNATGTIVAMTHILLPFMILPLYSVMKTIPPSYLRAAKSLGATNWTAFWRIYFPQSVPGIGAGSILVFILAIGYYITPEIVGGTSGIFISNRIAYHISSSLNWGLAAALGSILLVVVLVLYWAYDKIVGIDNVKLGG
ncbi:ABC transporter permease [Maritalea myrionectae]|uniref:Spermidine/putrescine transport system permease protein n=1 Tax=Maritalea myrionectae TaxID=454601 RepID=A0A2R4MC71_9HYPH|nr:ABC transporter permease [Maritalea myrionectae]AVX03534.1 spermidine/putrescine transport system permease protein [Maritalea myrionectae]